MKWMLALLIVAAAPLLASAQNKPAESWSDVELATFARSYTLGIPTVSYDTIVGKHVAYSGIAVQLFRAPNPLQLLNPWAPQTYAPIEPNLVVDPITKQPTGWKFFAIHF